MFKLDYKYLNLNLDLKNDGSPNKILEKNKLDYHKAKLCARFAVRDFQFIWELIHK